MKPLTDLALDIARDAGAAFADMRVVEERERQVFVQRRSLKAVHENETYGYGIRVLLDGAWGFASSTLATREEVERTARQAIAAARASARVPKATPARMAAEPAHIETLVGPCAEDPFAVPVQEQADLLLQVCDTILGVPQVVMGFGWLRFQRVRRIIANTDGTYVDLTNTFTAPMVTCTAVVAGESQSRQYQGGARQAGYEFIREIDLLGQARRWAEEAVMKCQADESPIGVMDLVLDPMHLALTMHESVGHPTESDRILGWEANFAGRSFVRPEDVGQLRYGSPLVNFSVDNAMAGAVGSWFYDDDGVKMDRFPMVRDGILAALGATRETAPILGWERSNGCCRAGSFDAFPINRIPNLYMEPGRDDAVTPESLIAGVDKGIYIQGQGSFSIDQMRRNFQFGGDLFWRIEGGKLTRPLKKVTYHAQTTEFWGSCDGVAGPSHWQAHGVMNCGKGEPPQSMCMTHGASTCRFRNIQVGDASK